MIWVLPSAHIVNQGTFCIACCKFDRIVVVKEKCSNKVKERKQHAPWVIYSRLKDHCIAIVPVIYEMEVLKQRVPTFFPPWSGGGFFYGAQPHEGGRACFQVCACTSTPSPLFPSRK